MKKLSIEQKAKRYDEAIEKAKTLYENANGMILKKWVEQVFPELKESEDEMIRKSLIDWFSDKHAADDFRGIAWERIVAWLEKQGEQKLTNKVEPFDKYEGLTDFERTLADICIGWIGEELGWKQYIKDNADVLLKIAVKKYNSIQDAPFEQKPAWSEEDEELMKWSIINLTELEDRFGEEYGKVGDCIDWLKSFKDRVQPKQEWSEEDEQYFNFLEKLLENLQVKSTENEIKKGTNSNSEYYYKVIQWLKSLRP